MAGMKITACVLVALTMSCRGQTEEDEKRPYKFAFNIEGYQHRSEEKDERGIIMGEFGFVTGDGVYHVTVYATDENGDFKILSMKNLYIGLPGEGTTVAPTRAPTSPPTPSTTKSAILKHLEGLMGCGGCIVPNKSNQPGGQPPSTVEGGIDVRLGGGPGGTTQPVAKPAYNLKPPKESVQRVSGGGGGIPSGGSGGQYPVGGGGALGGTSGGISNSLGGNGKQSPNTGGFQNAPVGGTPGFGAPQYNTPSGGKGGQFPQGGIQGSSPGPTGPGVGQAQITGGSPFSSKPGASPASQGTPNGQRTGDSFAPGGQPGKPQYSEGLPPGMSMEDLMALLYKFNYTLKYHGHHESGYRNGDKEGGYFFNGRDGLGRNVEYLANEFGFQPNITLVELGLNAPETPKEANEEPNELRGNEFKWFYKR